MRKKENRRIVCFEIDDFLAKAQSDPELINNLEDALVRQNALAARINVVTNELDVLIENPDLKGEDLLPILADFGLTARLKGTGP